MTTQSNNEAPPRDRLNGPVFYSSVVGVNGHQK